MPRIVKSIVLTGNGTNCEREMAHACRLAGSDEVDIVYIHEILNGEKRLDDYHFLNLPGGFLDGDDLGSAKAGANRIIHAKVKGSGEPLREQFLRFIGEGKLLLGDRDGLATRLWKLAPHLGVGMHAMSEAVYAKSSLSIREREVLRMRIAQLNQCVV